MKRFYTSRLLLLIIVLSGWNRAAVAQTVSYSQTFTLSTGSSLQCTAWQAFAGELNASYTYTGVTVSGSLDVYGRSSNNSALVTALATAIRTNTSYGPTTDGAYEWLVGPGISTDGYSALYVATPSGTPVGALQGACPSGGSAYIVRPCCTPTGTNDSWGGINGLTCFAPTQTMSVTFTYAYIAFTSTSPQPLAVCENQLNIPINNLLSTTDISTTPLTETWSIPTPAVGPSHGTLGGLPANGTTAGAIPVTPAGITYTPVAGYSGTDQFTIQVSDGTATNKMVVNVTVNPTPAGGIAGASCVTPGQTTQLSNGTTGGTWTSTNTAVATVNSTGLVYGALTGITSINYLLPAAACPATLPVTVNSTPGAITGNPIVCVGATTTLTDGGGSGTWTSSNTSVASVDNFGNVTGGTVLGPALITFTLPSTCSASTTVTVNTAPGPITGTASVCPGGTTPLNDVLGGGTWSSTSNSVATVGSTGTVTGVLSGPTNILYTLPSGCAATRPFTVNALPVAYLVSVSGTNSYCAGNSSVASILLNGPTSTSVKYQLFDGPISIGDPRSGTGATMSFGIQPAGIYTVIGTDTITGCTATMSLTGTISIKQPPFQYTVTQDGSSYCAGGAGVPIYLSGSAAGVRYYLNLTAGGTTTIVDSVNGFASGAEIAFGPQPLGGIYTVTAATFGAAPSCASDMIGAASVTINPLPDPTYTTITGGGFYCSGSPAGVDVGLNNSSTGISYQLLNDGVPQGLPVLGTGGPISFGPQTTVGSSYVVYATNSNTGCANYMSGATFVNTILPPTQYDVVGGGPQCADGLGFPVGLDGSDNGISYQLYNDGTAVGSAVISVGGPFNFGVYADSGTYTVIATNPSFGCVNTMLGSAQITTYPLPNVYTVTGGGSYCQGDPAGVHIGISGSQIGITYYIYNGGGSAINSFDGNGSPMDLGTYFATGSYTVVADNIPTGCQITMSGAAIININPLPLPYNVTGTGNYCGGGPGVDVGLDFSATGVNYQLWRSGVAVGPPMPGTGDALDFGFDTSGNYSIVGTNPGTGCAANMSGAAIVMVNPLPPNHLVSGGGPYCVGGVGLSVGIAGSDPGFSYQLYLNGTIASGTPVAGNGSSIDFGLQTAAGAYTVYAMDTLTFCGRNMPGVATIVVNPLPGIFSATGGGIFCNGASGAHIGLTGSNTGVHYLLYDTTALMSTLSGSGSSLDFGLQSAPGTYTIVATNSSTGCTDNMDGNAVIVANPLPTQYSVIGGGSYCNGAATTPSVGLGGSDAGINYQLYNGGAMIGGAVGGTGAAIDFGMQANVGSYTVVATDATTGCTNNMSGSAAVAINGLPSVFAIAGGGSYCAGGAGYHIYMSISSPGVQYVLYNGGGPAIDTVSGTGAGVDFGLQAAPGNYVATAMNPVTGCISNMAGTASINVNPLPAVHAVTPAGGGNYCVTGAGIHVGLDGSGIGIKYQLMNGAATIGLPISGTGVGIDFGIHPAGNYTVTATDPTTGCASNMDGNAAVQSIPLPNVYSLTGGGNYCTTGLGLHIGLASSDSGTQYQLYHGTAPFGSPITSIGGPVDFGLFTGAGAYSAVATNGGLAGCSNNMSGSAVISVYPVVVPTVSIATAGGDTSCVGNITHFSASSINGGTAPTYDWSVNGLAAASGSNYSYLPANGDMVTVKVHSNGICAIPDTATNSIRMTVSLPEVPSAHVTVSPGDVICQGTPVTFTGTTMYGGSHPTLTWVKNSVFVVGTGLTYSYTPANHDIIVLMLGSTFPCRLADTVFSNTNTMMVDLPIIPTVAISANPGTHISAGQSTTLTAVVVNPGSAPTYQWLINGEVIGGATSSSFTSSNLNDNDSVTCEVIGGCALKGFNSVRMHVVSEGVQQVTAAGSGNITLMPNPNKGVFTLKGTLATSSNESVSIEVTNMLGQVVYSAKATAQNGNINEKIQLNSSLSNGMYILNLRSGSQNNVFHFVIEQ